MEDSTSQPKRALKPIKTTLVGGLVFLVPAAIVVFIVGKVFVVVLKIAEPLGKLVPIKSIGGIAAANIIAVILLVGICYLAGIAARSAIGGKVSKFLDSKLEIFVPRYAFIKSMTHELAGSTDDSVFKTVLVTLDDASQIGFEVERSESGQVAVYMPGAPDPWSGSVIFVTEDRVKRLNADVASVVRSMKRVGNGMTAFTDPVITRKEKDT